MTGRQEYDRTKDRQRILGKYMIDRTPGRQGGPPGWLEENDPAGRIFLIMVALEGVSDRLAEPRAT